MGKTVRITALLLILLTVAVSAWKARVRTTEWTETLRVAVYPVSGDDSPVVDAYIAALKRPAFEAIAVFMRDQAQIHGLKLRAPVRSSKAIRRPRWASEATTTMRARNRRTSATPSEARRNRRPPLLKSSTLRDSSLLS